MERCAGCGGRQPCRARRRWHVSAMRVAWPQYYPVAKAQAEKGVVALTFDDGPHPEVTPAVLDLLDQAGARATFFCVGRRAEAHPDIVAAIRERGHGVENHTYSHPNGFAFMARAGSGERFSALRRPLSVRAAASRASSVLRRASRIPGYRSCSRAPVCHWCPGRGAVSIRSLTTALEWRRGSAAA